ncbi:MAG: helix-turn-helix transcriptional regulator [Rhizobium sp.]|nr:helix-turn-helix transcriptional regulator [Rhizobium sp.]
MKRNRIRSQDDLETQILAEAVFRPTEMKRFEESGLFDIKADIAAIQDMILWQTCSRSGYRARYGCAKHHSVEVHFIEAGKFTFQAADERIDAVAKTAVLLKDTRKVEIIASPDSTKLAISIPFDHVAPHLNRAHGSAGRGLSAFQSNIGPDVTGIDIIHRIAAHLLHGFAPTGASADTTGPTALVHDALIMMFVSLWPRIETSPDGRSGLPRHLERAIDWLDHHADQDISVEQLARRSGASIRTLQNSFRHHLSTTPNAYILQMRLSRVHDELQNGPTDETIEKIASRWGFGHMGYFASRYRELYGKTPSDTRRERIDVL